MDRARRLPQDLVEALVEAGLFRLARLPRAPGGRVDLLGFLDVAEALAGRTGAPAGALSGIVQRRWWPSWARRRCGRSSETGRRSWPMAPGTGATGRSPLREATASRTLALRQRLHPRYLVQGSGSGRGPGGRVLRAGRPARDPHLPLSRLGGLRGGHLARQRAAGHGEPHHRRGGGLFVIPAGPDLTRDARLAGGALYRMPASLLAARDSRRWRWGSPGGPGRLRRPGPGQDPQGARATLGQDAVVQDKWRG